MSVPSWLTAPLRLLSMGVFLTITVSMVLVCTPLQLLALPWDRRRRVSSTMYRWWWGRFLFWVHPSLKVRRTGWERLGPGPYIVASNHLSVLDVPSAFGLPLPLKVMIRAEHFRVPVVGAYLRLSRQVRLDRQDPESTQRGLQTARSALQDGDSLLIFPEGSRSADGRLLPFHRGAFRLSKDTGVPVLPFVQWGNQEVMPKGKLLQKRFRQEVVQLVLPPVLPSDFPNARAMCRHVEAQIAEALSGIRAESQP